MKNAFDNISQVVFLGIGGIGMSALAKYFLEQGKKVMGYDKTANDRTKELQAAGCVITLVDDIATFPQSIKNTQAETLVVYTPAIPATLGLLRHFTNQQYQVQKRAKVLASICQGSYTIAVAGTHGKTTTCCYIAHLLRQANIPFRAFLGGISSNYQTNYVSHGDEADAMMVVEADEYDRSFHALEPDVAVITNIEPDHLDIYGSFDHLLEAFQVFVDKCKEGGKIVLHDDYINRIVAGKELKLTSYGKKPGSVQYTDVHIAQHQYHFAVPAWSSTFVNGLPGEHNVANALAAMLATQAFVTLETRKTALQSFEGVLRRFDIKINTPDYAYIDDYAHHPTEIANAIATVRKLYPQRMLSLVFQPHLFSRTRDHADAFGKALSAADQLWLLPIYPAREEPIPGVDSQMLLTSAGMGEVLEPDSLLERIGNTPPPLLLTLGAGNIDLLVPKITQLYHQITQLPA